MTDFARRHAWEGAALTLFLGGLGLGYGALVSGAEKFAASCVPGMAAEASDQPMVPGAQLAVSGFAVPSHYSPQILFPVTSHFLPLWMALRGGIGLAPAAVIAPPPPAVSRPPSGRPAIAICMDDLGEDLAGTDRAAALPREVALSFLPYAEATPFLAQEAAAKGHTVLAHVPMEALSRTDPGPMVLKTGAGDIGPRLAWNLSRVPGLSGINNHEGSRFTEDAASLAPVMQMLAARHLFFFDSRTVPDSQGMAVAHRYGVTSAGRDIFLDDTLSEAAVRQQLDALAAAAKRQGVAIAIGHPHDVTLKVVAAWLAENHGVDLISLPEAMRRKNEMALASR